VRGFILKIENSFECFSTEAVENAAWRELARGNICNAECVCQRDGPLIAKSEGETVPSPAPRDDEQLTSGPVRLSFESISPLLPAFLPLATQRGHH
jgi:hypothetical protein